MPGFSLLYFLDLEKAPKSFLTPKLFRIQIERVISFLVALFFESMRFNGTFALMNYPWGGNRRFNSYTAYFQQQFGGRVQKISIDAGFTCPNRDGSKGLGGCTFCANDAFNPSYCQPAKSVTEQLQEGVAFHRKRYRRSKGYLAYFQAYTNTYAEVSKLQELYEEALCFDGVLGLVIGTRPDAVNDEVLELLTRLNQKAYVMVEYGVESVHQQTLERINRAHSYDCAVESIVKTAQCGLSCGAHLIFGLPGETHDMMLASVAEVSKLPLTTVKFHQLQIFKHTVMANEYLINPEAFKLFSLDEYVDFICNVTEQLNPDMVIERFAGEVPPRYLVSAPWGELRYDAILQLIERELEKRQTFQGKYFHSSR